MEKERERIGVGEGRRKAKCERLESILKLHPHRPSRPTLNPHTPKKRLQTKEIQRNVMQHVRLPPAVWYLPPPRAACSYCCCAAQSSLVTKEMRKQKKKKGKHKTLFSLTHLLHPRWPASSSESVRMRYNKGKSVNKGNRSKKKRYIAMLQRNHKKTPPIPPTPNLQPLEKTTARPQV